MDAKQFLKEKGISNIDFMDNGVADLIETLLTEYQALQLQQTGVICSALQEIWDFIENQEYNYLDGKMIKFANDIQFKIESKINEVRNGG